ncbi:biopolymer transporter ExbD [uncultured Lacinutrix sp.]|uniref:ExbD/TolR family protein n=1 Tax=uncultured Lacinutrix sp. TaxID=574032 RepID=UPI002620BCBE|nr:biopolymer transporter ExbD [uncultured Lacinutrix sp.]
MKIIKFLFILIIFNACSTSKNYTRNNINLPKGIEKIKVNSATPFYSIYVDKNEKVYLEKEEINIYNIAKILSYNKSKLPEELRFRVRIHLYIDQQVNYNIVDEIKTQLASIYLYNIYYKTNSIDDKDILFGIGYRNHNSFFHFANLKPITTKKQEKINKRYLDSLKVSRKGKDNEFFMSPPPPPPNHWSIEFIYRIYSNQQEVIDEVLSDKKSTNIEITNDGLRVNKEFIKFKEYDKLSSLFYNNDVLFVKFNKKLKYSNYFKMVRFYNNLKRTERALLIELSKEIIEIHKKAKIKI